MHVDLAILEARPAAQKLAPEAAVSKGHNDLLRPTLYPAVERTHTVLHFKAHLWFMATHVVI